MSLRGGYLRQLGEPIWVSLAEFGESEAIGANPLRIPQPKGKDPTKRSFWTLPHMGPYIQNGGSLWSFIGSEDDD